MPLKLKNMNKVPSTDYETVSILGLDIPLTRDLPFGGQVELLDTQSRHEQGEFGQFEYLMRMFCIFTRRLPKGEQVRYDWLARQDLEAEEMNELVNGTLSLLQAQGAQDEASGNAPKKTRAKPKAAES